MSDKTTVVSVPHAKAAKPGPWCNTTPTLLQRAKHRRHSLGDLRHELLAPRSVADEPPRAAASRSGRIEGHDPYGGEGRRRGSPRV